MNKNRIEGQSARGEAAMNIERQSQGVTYQAEFDFSTQTEWARPHGGGEGASPETAPTREQQVFAAWKGELNRDIP